MATNRICTLIALGLFSVPLAGICAAEESSERELIAELRKEVEELHWNFRFPINIERGTAAPIVPIRPAWLR